MLIVTFDNLSWQHDTDVLGSTDISLCWPVPGHTWAIEIPGTLHLLSGQDDTTQTDPGWTEVHLLLHKLVTMGLHCLPDICDGNTIVLPTTISGEANSVCRRVLNRVTASRGSLVRWVDMTPPTRAILPGPRTPYLIRPGDTGQTLLGGHVRLKSKGVTKVGTITAYDDTTSQYSIEFQDFSIMCWWSPTA